RHERVAGGGRHEERVHARDVPVHLGHVQLVLEVGAGTQALDYGCWRARLPGPDDQPRPGFDAQVGEVFGGLLDHRDALVGREHALLVGIHQHRHDDLVELGGGALEDVDVAEGHRIERSGAYGAAHGGAGYAITA